MIKRKGQSNWEGVSSVAIMVDDDRYLTDEVKERLVHWMGWLQEEAVRGRLKMPPGEWGERCTSCPSK